MDELIKYGSACVLPKLNANSYSSTTVVVVGCGGTGGRLIPELAQHICNHNNELRTNPRNRQYLKHEIKMLLVDMDTVELKNLRRQNFFKFDVGKNKARVFAERYSALFGMDIRYSEREISNEYNPIRMMRAENMIVFDCTDNVKARRAIEASLLDCNNVLISCGNEDTFGQVLLSCRQGNLSSGRTIGWIRNDINYLMQSISQPDPKNKISISDLPTLLELYRDFKDTDKPSCTEMVLQDEQSMPINATVAQLAYNIFYNVVAGNSFKYNMVKCNINNTFTTNYISHPKDLLRLCLAGLLGDSGPDAQTAYKEFDILLGAAPQAVPYEKFNALVERHGRLSIPFIKLYLQSNWRLDAAHSGALSEKIARWQNADLQPEV